MRYLQPEDKEILVTWLSNPSVLAFYEGRDNAFGMARVEEEFFNREDGVHRCIVENGRKQIGYIQFYSIQADDSLVTAAWSREKICGMDQFIGEPEEWNKGIGTKLVTAMVHYLTEHRKVDRIIMDPQVANKRAISCYEKCGFKKVKRLPTHEYHEGEYRDCWLMTYGISSL